VWLLFEGSLCASTSVYGRGGEMVNWRLRETARQSFFFCFFFETFSIFRIQDEVLDFSESEPETF